MRNRSFVAAVAGVMVIAACGGGSDDADVSLPEITLITTTTSLAPFEPSDSVPASRADDTADEVGTTPSETDSSEAAGTAPADTVPPDPAATAAPEIAATTVAPETTAAPPGSEAGFSLQNDGLGVVSFGADPDGVITFVTSFLGGATADTGWVDPFTIGACGGTQIRQVSWGDLQLEFGDVSDVVEGRPHFYAYYYGREGSSTATPGGLETNEGISVGSTVAQLLQAYPGAQLLSGNEFVNDSFSVNDNLRGRLSGLTDVDVVQMVIGGLPCES
jgi:hypothetical protein